MRAADVDGVYLMFPGQGSQYPRMGVSLYGSDPVFTHWMDSAFLMMGEMGNRLKREWLNSSPGPRFDDVRTAQPLLYMINHALGKVVMGWGVELNGLLGHSVGELVAATLAGVIAFEDGVGLMVDRVHAFAETAAGGMAAVAASEEEVSPFLSAEIHLAAVNAPRQTIIAGRVEPLERTLKAMTSAGITCSLIPSQQAFHSPLVNPGVAASVSAWEATPLAPPSIAVISAYLPGRLTDAAACDPHFWATQPADLVRFDDALREVLALRPAALVECGPSGVLTAIARKHRNVRGGQTRAFALLPGNGVPAEEELEQIGSVRAALHELALRATAGNRTRTGDTA